MFQPKYEITGGLLANIKRITEIVTDLNARKFPNLVLAKLEREAREMAAYSSTSIEGNPLPLTDVKRILKNRPEHVQDSEREVLNYNKALAELESQIQGGKFALDLAIILRIQKTVTDGLIDAYRSGKLREEPVFVNNPKVREVVYLPPDHDQVPALMRELLTFINESKQTVDPLIIAGIFHRQFVLIHPFVDGNGRTARLATKALLANVGIDTFNLFSFENYYNRNITRYFEEVGERGNYYEIRDTIDFTSWLEYFTEGIIDELLRVRKEIERESAALPDARLEDHHLKIIAAIEEHGSISDREYAKLTDRARPTRNLDFRKLLGMGLIERTGKGRATRYVLKTIL